MEGSVPRLPLPLRPAQLQQQLGIGPVTGQGVNQGKAHLFFGQGQLGQKECVGFRTGSLGDDLHPAGHLPLAGGVKAGFQQRENIRPLPAQDFGVQVSQISVAVPQAGNQSGEDTIVGKKFRMALNGLLDHAVPPAASPGEGLQQGLELAIGDLLIGPRAVWERGKLPRDTCGRLSIDHCIHQSQHVQQSAAPLLRRGGQQRVQAGADSGKHRAGGGQGGQLFPGPLQPKVLVQDAGARHGGVLQPLLHVIQRL